MKYCPVINGHIDTSVTAIGIVGVWRATQLEFENDDQSLFQEMEYEECQFQPEVHSFCVTEISSGNLHFVFSIAY